MGCRAGNGKIDKSDYDRSVYHGESFLPSIDNFVVHKFALFAYERSGFIILGGVGWGDFYSQNSIFDGREVGNVETASFWGVGNCQNQN